MFGVAAWVFNPNGIEAFSPGWRASRYPGLKEKEITTLQGLNLFYKSLIFNPFRVVEIKCGHPG